MSRACVNEDAEGPEPTYSLPKRDDPGYDAAAAWALIEGWNQGDPRSAVRATGYRWGEPKLKEHVERILSEALERDDERLESLARRFLRKAAASEDR
jgi:hypothetical protein